jgi:uncharacterized protein YjbI with pentapeptide repeats
MADEEHIALLKQGAKVWLAWRTENPDIMPDLSNAHLDGKNLSRTYLRDADFSGANLIGANLSGSELHNANLSDADLRRANFHHADLSDAHLRRANLSRADLRSAYLGRADLSGAHFSGADLRQAFLRNADLSRANLIESRLCNADFRMATLIDTRLDGADLTGAKLWEAQRSGWSIKGIICKQAFWDRDGKEPSEYEDGAFERIFAEKTRIVLRYVGGMSAVDLAMLPLIIERLQIEHPNSLLHIRSVQDDGSGATVTITVEDLANRRDEAFKRDIEVIRRDLTDYQERWRLSERNLLRIEAKYEELKENFNKVIDMPKYVVGQAGSVGDNAHAHNMTFQQAWNQSNIDLTQLAEELTRLRAAMKQETQGTREQDKAIVVVADAEEAAINGDGPTTLQHLKAVGTWALSVAEKIGVTVATEAIKRAM